MGRVIFLGSFDPPTNGHLHLISEALSHGVSEVVMVPAWRNPWKTGQTSFKDRLEMCRDLCYSYYPGRLEVSGIERSIAREKDLETVPSYLTLEELRRYYDFKILTTNETYREIPGWIHGEEILRDYEFMILSSDHLGDPIPGSISIHDLPISSSLVRGILKGGGCCPEYLPAPVLNYIREHDLYKL